MTPPRLPHLCAPVSAPAGPAPAASGPLSLEAQRRPHGARGPRPGLPAPGEALTARPSETRAAPPRRARTLAALRGDGPARVGGRVVLTSWLVVPAMSPASVGRPQLRATTRLISVLLPASEPAFGFSPRPAVLRPLPRLAPPPRGLGGTSATPPPPPAPTDRSRGRCAAVLIAPRAPPSRIFGLRPIGRELPGLVLRQEEFTRASFRVTVQGRSELSSQTPEP